MESAVLGVIMMSIVGVVLFGLSLEDPVKEDLILSNSEPKIEKVSCTLSSGLEPFPTVGPNGALTMRWIPVTHSGYQYQEINYITHQITYKSGKEEVVAKRNVIKDVSPCSS